MPLKKELHTYRSVHVLPLVLFSIPNTSLVVEGTPVLTSGHWVGHIVPQKGDNFQDRTPLTPGLAAGILETGSSPDALAF